MRYTTGGLTENIGSRYIVLINRLSIVEERDNIQYNTPLKERIIRKLMRVFNLTYTEIHYHIRIYLNERF